MRSVILAAALAWSLTGRAAAETPRDTFAYDITGDVDTLDPHWEYDVVSQMVAWQTYETLIFYKGPSLKEFEPLLASVVPSRSNSFISADGKRYTFPIRKGVVFHDGTLMTPEDVKYSFMRFLLLDRAGGPSALLLEPLLGMDSTRDKDGKLKPGVFEAADAAILVQGGSV
ncbi:MAG: ABC transporter substrate-binding protein, partial [Elusimicrobia bacterium]|nr:ABC transporter substrate-binding protein [Elusimicrobiota bacterium]